jgi:hypothetical protein
VGVQKMTKWIAVLISVVALAFATSCKTNQENDDLAKAQKCLDEVTDPSQAESCLTMVGDYSSQQALVLKCGIILTWGGLMENKVIAAYNALKDNSQTNKAASFMAAIALDKTDINVGYARAQQADPYCQATGVPGLKYLSGVILAGSYMNVSIAAVTGSPVDITDPAALNTAVNDYITKCGANPPDASCPADASTLGSAALGLSSSYCSGSGANQDVCNQIDGAVNSAGGDPAAVGQAVLCYMNNKTFNPGTGQCN